MKGDLLPIDPRTGRPIGDHGTADQAINFALDELDFPEIDDFLRAWREGGAFEEWPDFYSWLSDLEGDTAHAEDGGSGLDA